MDAHPRRTTPSPFAPAGLTYLTPVPYHVRVHVEGRGCRLGSVSRVMRLSPFGRVARHYGHQLPQKFLQLRLVAFDIQPTCFEALIEVVQPVSSLSAGAGSSDPSLLRLAVRWFKAMTTAAYGRGVQTKGWAALEGLVWERGYERLLLRHACDRAALLERLGP